MKNSLNQNVHTFHIPVMGTGFTIDTPLKVARYGISSAISLIDDVIIEQMRKYHSEKWGIRYEEIKKSENDFRARRITAYLNLLDTIIKWQIKNVKNSEFTEKSEITKYYNILPDSDLKRKYIKMLNETDTSQKTRMKEELRERVVPGKIEANIMTKCDRYNYRNGQKLPPEYSDAMAAFRGFALSNVSSNIIFSAGLNQRLFKYIAEFDDFLPDENGEMKKGIVLKVSDYRSGLIQGKILAKNGVWISEFRIESGLNCGGHAFAGKGHLLGQTLEEYKEKRGELIDTMFKLYSKALSLKGLVKLNTPPVSRITVQGGIGTGEEDNFLLDYYNLDGTGWGTPFLLIPEVVNVDEKHLEKLARAKMKDIYLSNSSPLDVPFWNLKKSASEITRRQRIRKGTPGSPCPKRYAAFNCEFTSEPICTASRKYQELKIADLKAKASCKKSLIKAKIKSTLQKSCICNDLSGSVLLNNNIDGNATPAITTGPNIINFSSIFSLEELVNNIYGRIPIPLKKNRKHMFITELGLNIEKLKKDIWDFKKGLLPGAQKHLKEYKKNLAGGIEYYKKLADQIIDDKKQRFLADLQKLARTLDALTI